MSFGSLRELIVIGGVSGAGKSTLARVICDLCGLAFVTNEEINRQFFNGHGSKNDILRKQLVETERLMNSASSFVLEHTLKGRSIGCLIQEAKKQRFTVTLIYIHLKNIDLANERNHC